MQYCCVLLLSLLQSKIKSSWVMSTINTKRCLKNVKGNEGVVMVTYSTMSCFGLPVRGVQLTDHSWPSVHKEGKKPPPLVPVHGLGQQNRRGTGERSGSLQKATQLPPSAFLSLYLPSSLRVSCHIFFSC